MRTTTTAASHEFEQMALVVLVIGNGTNVTHTFSFRDSRILTHVSFGNGDDHSQEFYGK
jgi:hypothetical protein